jgi:hypothetical protein
VQLHSCIVYTIAGVDPGGLLGCRPLYASPRIVSSGTDMFSHDPSLDWLHHRFHKLPKLQPS